MMTRSDHSDRRVAERIERLRTRLKDVPQRSEADGRIVAVLMGLLDLLMDEL